MTLREAADRLGITPDSLRQAIARGSLKAEKRGRDWWVTERQLAAYRRPTAVPTARSGHEKAPA